MSSLSATSSWRKRKQVFFVGYMDTYGGPESRFPGGGNGSPFRLNSGGNDTSAPNTLTSCSMRGNKASPATFEKLVINVQNHVHHPVCTCEMIVGIFFLIGGCEQSVCIHHGTERGE